MNAPIDARRATLRWPLLIAWLLSLLAGFQVWRLIQGLPGAVVAHVNGTPEDQRLTRGAIEAIIARSPEVRDGALMAEFSRHFTRAFRGGDAAAAERTIAQNLSKLRQSGFGRVQLLAARLLMLERSGAAPAAWGAPAKAIAATIQPGANSTRQYELERAWADAFVARGAPPGVARQLGHGAGNVHGPLLAYLAPRVERAAGELSAAGDAAGAESLRRMLRNVLGEVVRAAGPSGLRLLAADLLVEQLRGDPALAAQADGLRRWTERWRSAAAARPLTVIGAGGEATLAPNEHASFCRALGALFWCAGGLAALLPLSLLSVARTGRQNGRPGLRSTLLRSGFVCVLVAAGGAAWALLAGEFVRADLLLANTPSLPGWRSAALAATVTVILTMGSAWRSTGAGGARVGRVAGVSAFAAAGAALVTVVVAGQALAAQNALDRGIQRAADDPITAISGAGHESLLTAVDKPATGTW